VNATALIRAARRAAGLSKRALAARAGTSPAAIVLYEAGERDPGVETVERILLAAGRAAPRLDPELRRVDRHRNAARLAAVLELAEHLPHRPAARRLRAPLLPPMPPRTTRSRASR
jgi:transcriptional regulator with XRE-family HTH domain